MVIPDMNIHMGNSVKNHLMTLFKKHNRNVSKKIEGSKYVPHCYGRHLI